MGKEKEQQYMCAFACLDCKKVFKRPVEFPHSKEDDVKKCQHCGSCAYNVGRNFHAPKQSDDKAWALVDFLIRNGFVFQKVYEHIENGSVKIPYPKSLEEAREFVKKYKDQAIFIEE